jgi:hypothetical protein
MRVSHPVSASGHAPLRVDGLTRLHNVQSRTWDLVASWLPRPKFLTGNNETCTLSNPVAGDWYVMVRRFAAFSGVTLRGTTTP